MQASGLVRPFICFHGYIRCLESFFGSFYDFFFVRGMICYFVRSFVRSFVLVACLLALFFFFPSFGGGELVVALLCARGTKQCTAVETTFFVFFVSTNSTRF